MKKLFFLILFPFLGFAQIDFTLVYHPIINEAELAITDSNYIAALKLYDEAFSNVSETNGFAYDYYNAAVCAYITKKQSLCFDYLLILANKGYKIDSLQKLDFVKMLSGSANWIDFEKKYRSIPAKIDFEYRDKIVNLLKTNPHNVIKYPDDIRKYHRKSFELQRIYGSEKAIPKDSISIPISYEIRRDSVDTLYFDYQKKYKKAFYSLVDEYGFPDEDVLGVGVAYGENLNIQNILGFVEINQSKNLDFERLLQNACRSGKLHPRNLQHLFLDTNDGNNPYNYGQVVVFQVKLEPNVECAEKLMEKGGKWLWKPEITNEEELQKVNHKRKTVGLESLDDFYTKAFYFNSTTWFISYKNKFIEEITYAPSCAVLEQLLKNAEEVYY